MNRLAPGCRREQVVETQCKGYDVQVDRENAVELAGEFRIADSHLRVPLVFEMLVISCIVGRV